MKLTTTQRKTLLFLHSFRPSPPTIWRQFIFNWFAWLPLLVIGLIGTVVALTPGFTAAGLLCIGLVCGAFFRDIGRYRGLVHIWPVYSDIINWQRVSELLESSEKHDA